MSSGKRIPRLLLAMCGNASPHVIAAGGDYDGWFERGFAGQAELVRRDVFLGQDLHDLESFDGLVVSGSGSSVLDDALWMRTTAARLRQAAADGHPVLAVCFGHQLLAHAGGGQVERHARGREIGTVDVQLTGDGLADPLLGRLAESLGPRWRVQTTHGDHVARLPSEAVLLAGNPHSSVQAFRLGRRALGVQFHPELDQVTMRAMLEARSDEVREQARARGEDAEARLAALFAGLEEVATGTALLSLFARRVVEGW
jgi:GMP synthase (glutamine-hydrolysing)